MEKVGSLTAKIDEAKKRKIKIYPVYSNRASQVGYECERELVYERTRWNEKLTYDLGLQYIFDEGRFQETKVMDDLREARIEIVEGQRPFEDKQLQLTGRIDFKISLDGGKPIPVEFKGLSPYSWEALNSFEDIRRHKKHYIRKYATQMQLYLFLMEEEEGIMLLRNKLTGRYREIWVKLDYDYCGEIVKKIERVNACLKAETLPDQREWDDGICGECPFLHICLPDRNFGGGLEVSSDPELINDLERREELKEASRKFREVDERVRKKIKGKEMLIGNFEIKGEWREKDIKATEGKHIKYWQSKILKIPSKAISVPVIVKTL